MVELPIKEYLEIAQFILENNEYQRRKVIKSNIQDLLKSDLLKGCTIPSIVLAVKRTGVDEHFNYKNFNDKQIVVKIFNDREMLLLDGLQRTYVMLEIKNDIESEKISQQDAQVFLNQTIRAELYVGLKKLSLLYRMLTLNTGQTTMSTRHLMEILYLDYFNQEIDGIKLITDKDAEQPAETTNEFKFKDILDGYYSFIEGTEILIERADILDNIQTIKELERTDEEKEGFKKFLITFKKTIDKLIDLSDGFEYNDEDFQSPELQLSGPPFAKNALAVFKKSQAFTGFGAALNFITNRRSVDFDKVIYDVDGVVIERSSGNELYKIINKHFDYIRNRSKKVGNDQRFYFKVFFQNLFDPSSDNYRRFDLSIEQAYKRIKERIED